MPKERANVWDVRPADEPRARSYSRGTVNIVCAACEAITDRPRCASHQWCLWKHLRPHDAERLHHTRAPFRSARNRPLQPWWEFPSNSTQPLCKRNPALASYFEYIGAGELANEFAEIHGCTLLKILPFSGRYRHVCGIYTRLPPSCWRSDQFSARRRSFSACSEASVPSSIISGVAPTRRSCEK